jgi:uroporphyrin-III C-methyltransferase
VQSACTGAQRHLVTTLGRLAADIAASAIGSPAIIVVGDVVRYAQDARLSQFADPAPERAGHLDRTRAGLIETL